MPENHKRWIIVTTINYPTESIRILANMTDWKVNHLSDSVVYYIVIKMRTFKTSSRCHCQTVPWSSCVIIRCLLMVSPNSQAPP